VDVERRKERWNEVSFAVNNNKSRIHSLPVYLSSPGMSTLDALACQESYHLNTEETPRAGRNIKFETNLFREPEQRENVHEGSPRATSPCTYWRTLKAIYLA
jgi:hypothetical protein